MAVTPMRSRRRTPPAPPPRPSEPPGRRLRRIGTLVLTLGTLGAALLYWIETHHAGPSMEQLMPGYTRAHLRQTGILYGHAGQTFWELSQTMARPEVHAAAIVGVSVLVAIGCFRVAWLDDHADDE